MHGDEWSCNAMTDLFYCFHQSTTITALPFGFMRCKERDLQEVDASQHRFVAKSAYRSSESSKTRADTHELFASDINSSGYSISVPIASAPDHRLDQSCARSASVSTNTPPRSPD